MSPEFSLLGADVEFSIGMCEFNEWVLITFGFQDNAAYLLKVDKQFLDKFLDIWKIVYIIVYIAVKNIKTY